MPEQRKIYVGNVPMGGDAPIVVQSMTNTDTSDVSATVKQILGLEKAGCEIIRVSVLDMKAAQSISKIKKQIHIPLVADIHFDYHLALEAVAQGVDKVRINPGNIKGKKNVQRVIDACKEKGIPIRIGVNGGSLEKDLVVKYGNTPAAAVESCLRHVKILEDNNFEDMALSVKFSAVSSMIECYRILAKKVPYPLHLGVTHAGTVYNGTIKNAIGIGVLLLEGIGSTIRVSLAGSPLDEMRACWSILSALGLRHRGPEVIACPTCGRTEIDVAGIAEEVEKMLADVNLYFKVAIMGCFVNGPREATDADVGIAGGREKGVLFANGKKLRSVRSHELLVALKEEINKLIEQKRVSSSV